MRYQPSLATPPSPVDVRLLDTRMARASGYFKPLKDKVICTRFEEGERITRGGLILADDNGKDSGIRPRWCQVWRVGSEVQDIAAGLYALVAHGRWTRGIELTEDDHTVVIRMVDPNDILMLSDELPEDVVLPA